MPFCSINSKGLKEKEREREREKIFGRKRARERERKRNEGATKDKCIVRKIQCVFFMGTKYFFHKILVWTKHLIKIHLK